MVYYAGPTGLLAERVDGTLYYLATNHLGSVSAAFTTDGTPVATQAFSPYGRLRASSGTMPMSYAYTGQRADSATGLDYYGARYYDPALSQAMRTDRGLRCRLGLSLS